MRISDWSSDVCSSDLLLLLNYRPDYNAAIVQAMSGETLLLHPLADADLEGLARTLLGADPSLTRAIRTLVQRAGGHPYFVEEAVLALADGGWLAGSPRAWRLARPLDRTSTRLNYSH